ncbi:hypothetical protein ACM6Q7_08690 [Peribacillus butanolivorans]|uniref:hypothetical protein n=1 Tax=Peribacillus butanolivorans TaxID=421767 RepID=UPI0039FB98E8
MSGVVKISELENQLMNRIERDDLTINTSQEFIKTNPALNELNKLTKTLIALEKSINFEMVDVQVIPEDEEKDNDEPKVSDLY